MYHYFIEAAIQLIVAVVAGVIVFRVTHRNH